VVSNRHNESRLSSTAATTAAAAGAAQVNAADSAVTEAAASGTFAATTTAATATTALAAAAPTPFASGLADRSYNSPQDLVSAYEAAREESAPPSSAKSVDSPVCAFAGEFIGSITYRDTPAELFVATDSSGRAHLTALAVEDCHRVIEVTVP
jgi:hypothetical protein